MTRYNGNGKSGLPSAGAAGSESVARKHAWPWQDVCEEEGLIPVGTRPRAGVSPAPGACVRRRSWATGWTFALTSCVRPLC